jgi:hypothetical protein
MAILEHLIPDAGEHLTRWRETLDRHACRIEEQLDSIREAIQDAQVEQGQMTRHITGDGNSGTGNSVTITLDPPLGYEWELTLLACVGGADGGLALYLGAVDPSAILFVVPSAQLASEILPDIPIPAGARLVAHFYAQPVNATCSIRLIAKSTETSMGAGE